MPRATDCSTNHATARWLVVAVLGLVLVAAACGSGSTSSTSAAAPTTTVAPTTTTAPSTTTTQDPATLPQTRDKPVGSGSPFEERARGLWDAIVADDPSQGMSFFFPLPAYQQVKAISNPTSDWHNRLIAEYRTDIHALHVRLGSAAATATYQGISVPDAAAVWVTPGQEYNKIGYWRVYGTTLRYSVDGVTHTLPVTSLISWRGQWFVVHLGAIR